MSKNSSYDLKIDRFKLKSSFNFAKDLGVGKEAEESVFKSLTDEELKVEVKRDDWTLRTGNIAVEFECRGKPSGVQVTESNEWWHVLSSSLTLRLETRFVKWLFESLGDKPQYIKEMGDSDGKGGKVAKSLLIPWADLLKLNKEYEKHVSNSEKN
jgi:hypothetical protein